MAAALPVVAHAAGTIQFSSFPGAPPPALTKPVPITGFQRGKSSTITFTMMFSRATPASEKALTAGTHIRTAQVNWNRQTLDLQEVFITNSQISGASEVPTVSITLSYNHLTLAGAAPAPYGKGR